MGFFLGAVFCLGAFPGLAGAPGDEHWDTRFGWPGVTNYVNALAYRDGKLCVVGENPPGGLGPGTFHSSIDLWDGTAWRRLGAIFGDPRFTASRAAVFVGSDLYVGGSFSNVNGLAAAGLAKWDGVQWSSVGGFSGDVRALATDGTQLFVGGTFDRAGTVPATNIARWDGSAWSAMGPGLGTSTTLATVGVRALLWNGSQLFAGGGFTTSGGVSMLGLARWSGTAWIEVGGGVALNAGQPGRVNALAWTGAELVVGGDFLLAGNLISPNIARWNGSSWLGLLPSNVQEAVSAVAALNGNIYIAGGFTNIAGNFAPGLARWNGNNWFSAGLFDGFITSLVTDGTNLIAGGVFSQIDGVVVNNVARRQGTNWLRFGSGDGLSTTARKVIRSGDALYAAGFFTGAGNVAANRIARWDGARWSPLGGGIIGANPNLTLVTTLSVGNSELFAAGVFTNAGGVRASNIAGWLLPSGPWRPLGPGLNGQVQALATDGGVTYAGGIFTSAGSVPISRIGAWNGSSWSEVGGGVNSNVNAVVVSPSGLYIGGRFTMAGSIPANRVARWDGVTWRSLGVGAENGVNGSVTAIAVNGSDVFVGGVFSLAGTTPAARVAHWDGTRWLPLGSGFAGGSVNDLLFHNSSLYAAGSFTNADALGSRGIARWDGTNWSSLGSGLNFLPATSSAFSLAAFDDDLFVAGVFSGAGGKDSRFIARWNERISFDPSLHLSSTRLGPQGIRVRVVANSIPRYLLEASTNFSAWLPLATNSAPTLDYTDPQTPAVPHRFFRARGL